jgi:hypothetical protein
MAPNTSSSLQIPVCAVNDQVVLIRLGEADPPEHRSEANDGPEWLSKPRSTSAVEGLETAEMNWSHPRSFVWDTFPGDVDGSGVTGAEDDEACPGGVLGPVRS